MDKNSKILFFVFFLAALAAIGVSFYKYYILEDFYILAEKSCDPAGEGCFVRECDPSSDFNCPKEGEKRLVYYTLVTKKANAIPKCDPKDSSCRALDCQEGEDCTEVFCDEATKAEEEVCSNPEEYLKGLEQEPQPENNLSNNPQE
ncbi:MAG: hypothetical protein WC926_02635 [Candidatus Paceibacterota bacterium]|jgi:hypothetical protein